MAPTFKITEQVRDVLVRSSIDATSVKLPPEHLDRALYVAVDKVLKAAGGKWDRKAGAHLFDRDPREALGLAIETGEATNLKQQFQAFYTPAPLAARMAELADVKPGMLVLEPSAGMGALAEAVNQVPEAGRAARRAHRSRVADRPVRQGVRIPRRHRGSRRRHRGGPRRHLQRVRDGDPDGPPRHRQARQGGRARGGRR